METLEVSTTHPPFRERATYPLVRNHCSFFSIPLPLFYIERRFVSKHKPTPIQSVESVLELGELWEFAKRSWWGLADAIGQYCRIWKVSENKTLRSPFVFVSKHKLTPIQSVESVLELGELWEFAKRSWWGLADAIGQYCRIWKVSEKKILRSPLVAGVWRA